MSFCRSRCPFAQIGVSLNNDSSLISSLHEPQGIAFARSADLFAGASAVDGSVRFFGAAVFSSAGVIDLGDDSDKLASSVGGPAEILEHERTDLLFPPRDATALA